jgi:hypothetical protein
MYFFSLELHLQTALEAALEDDADLFLSIRINYFKNNTLIMKLKSYAKIISTIPPTIKNTYGNLLQIHS